MIELVPLFELVADVSEPQVIPEGPYGTRRFIPVAGGSFRGDRLDGTVMPGGSDCQLVRPDGVAELDVRVALQTRDGTILFMRGLGLRHGSPEVMRRIGQRETVSPASYYFRETMLFEAPPGPYAWLNRIIAIGTGERLTHTVRLSVYEIL
jgi:hypothetical protein